jgi:hypothetical protein
MGWKKNIHEKINNVPTFISMNTGFRLNEKYMEKIKCAHLPVDEHGLKENLLAFLVTS